MEVTFGPFITCFLAVFFLMVYMVFTIYVRKNVLYNWTKPIFILISIILLRMLIPFNFPFTITIRSYNLLAYIEHLLFSIIYGTRFRWADILFCLWISGTLVQTLRMFLKHFKIKKCLYPFRVNNLKQYPPINKIMEFHGIRNLPVYIVPINISPMIMGVIHPIFVIPDIKFTDYDLFYACEHEIRHYKNHDHWLKLFLNLVLCTQWFNLFAYILNHELTLVLELGNDQRILQSCTEIQRVEYAECIVKVADNMANNQCEGVGLSFVNHRRSDLKTRMTYIMRDDFRNAKEPVVCIILQYIMVIFAFLVAIFVVPEGYYMDDFIKEETINIDKNSYFIKSGDEYELFVDGESWFMFAYIPEEFADLNVYEEEDLESEEK